jgi:hypothetical protein
VLRGVFDSNDDCEITVDEVVSGGVADLFAPDLHLFDANGNFASNHDGIVDSVSLGLQFTGVRATFDTP